MAFDREQVDQPVGYEQLLENNAQWAQGHLAKRIDKSVYANHLIILRRKQQFVRADELRARGETPVRSELGAAQCGTCQRQWLKIVVN